MSHHQLEEHEENIVDIARKPSVEGNLVSARVIPASSLNVPSHIVGIERFVEWLLLLDPAQQYLTRPGSSPKCTIQLIAMLSTKQIRTLAKLRLVLLRSVSTFRFKVIVQLVNGASQEQEVSP
jgi:hypothetical protein